MRFTAREEAKLLTRFGTEVKYVKDNLLHLRQFSVRFKKCRKHRRRRCTKFTTWDMAGGVLQARTKYPDKSGKEFEIEAQVVGRTEPSDDPSGKNHLEINLADEILQYE